MAVLSVLSGNQLQAVSGRKSRPVLGDLLEASRADLPSQIAARQRQREMKQRDRELSLQEQQMASAEDAQRRGQTQQLIGTGISTIGQTALLAKTVSPTLFGLTGPSTAAAGAGAAGAGAAGAGAAGVGVAEAAGLAGEGALWGATSATTAGAGAAGAGSAGSLAAGIGAAAAPALAGAGLGYGAGKLIGLIPGDSKKAKIGKGLGSAAVGAAAGFAVGGPIGAIAGGIFGGLSGGGKCVIHEAGYGRDSVEVRIARKFRDNFMSTAQLRAYYKLYEDIAHDMTQDQVKRDNVRKNVTDRLVRYGAALTGVPYDEPPSMDDIRFAQDFLRRLSEVGKDMGPYTRRTGEIV